ncbi:MAG: hypothetical protein WCH31_03195 [Actinomycetes bacterium]
MRFRKPDRPERDSQLRVPSLREEPADEHDWSSESNDWGTPASPVLPVMKPRAVDAPPPARVETFDTAPARDQRAGLPLPVLAVLVVALIGGGVLLGRGNGSSKHTAMPSAHAATTTGPATTTASRTPSAPVKAKPTPSPAVAAWGPLAVQEFGTFPKGVTDPAVAIAAGQVVVVGGAGSADVLAGAPGSALGKVASLPAARGGAAVFASGTTLYVIGGEAKGKPTDAIVRVGLDTGHAAAGGTFIEPLVDAGVFAAPHALLLAGGWTGQKFGTAVIRFAPGGTPTIIARLPVGVRAPTVTQLGGKLYVAGGTAAGGASSSVYAVDLASGAVALVGTLPQAVAHAIAVVSAGKLYLLGGTGAAGQDLTSVIRFDPATGGSAIVGTLPTTLAGATSVPYGDTALVVTRTGTVYRVG